MFEKHKSSVGMDMAVSCCNQSQWVRNPSEVTAALAHKLVSTTGAALRGAAASPASAATCWLCLAQMSCTRATLASFHPLNLSAVSAWSVRTCSITCRSASFDWQDRNRKLTAQNSLKYWWGKCRKAEWNTVQKKETHLQSAVERPDAVQSVIDNVVFTAFYEGGPEFPLCRWFTISYRWQTGFFQMDVQLLHLIRDVHMVCCNNTWRTTLRFFKRLNSCCFKLLSSSIYLTYMIKKWKISCSDPRWTLL